MTDVSMRVRYMAACAIAREAGSHVRAKFRGRDEALTLKFKGPQDYLTETDGEVERLISQRLAEAFPDDGFFGEEGGGSYELSVWIVDPIDGTADFAMTRWPTSCLPHNGATGRRSMERLSR